MALAGPLMGKGAVVTGGGRGIGMAVARALVGAGARVVVSARSRDEIEAVAAELSEEEGAEAHAVVADVTDPEAVAELAEQATGVLEQVDILVNNAGSASSAPLPELELSEWNRLFAVNATGTFLCTQALIAPMAERRWGRVVNVASVAGRHGAGYISAYCASKHAVVGFTRAIAVEYAQRGVTVNAVCPGYVDTPMTGRTIRRIGERTGRTADEVIEYLEAQSPQGRIFQPQEVAHLVVTLCADAAGGVNGQAIVLDGGGVQS